MLLRPLLSTALYAIFAATYLTSTYGVAYMVVSVAIVNVFTNAIQGAGYEAREEMQDLRFDIIQMSPGGFPAFVTAHALIQTLLATLESALLSALFIPFAQYPVVQEMAYLIIGVGLLLAISFMAAVVGVHVLIRRNNFLAVSFSSVLLITFADAFYPIDSLPTWAATIAAYNPITYLVDIIRAALFGIEPLLAPPLEIGICTAFLVGLIIAASCVAHCPFDTSNVQNV